MKINRNQLLTILSEALDCVEKEVLGVTDHHAKRVAWLCIEMGKAANLSKEEISDLAVGALLHDNALNEFKDDYENRKLRPNAKGDRHCVAGERNLRLISKEQKQLRGFILYHHENADGSGPFGKKEGEVPLGAEIIHVADIVDLEFALGKVYRNTNKSLEEVIQEMECFIERETGKSFSRQAAKMFLDMLRSELFEILSDDNIETLELDFSAVYIEADRGIAELFARIIDYKSPFTQAHSTGLAKKAEQMAKSYGFDEIKTEKFYMSGALHDIGKLFVDIEVLEKPGRLDEEEYKHIQSHAYETYRLLSKIEGFEEIRDWASYHHEKLNGKGYPFGLTAKEMSLEMRLLACLDIYQALTEDRPYKAGMSHSKTIGILYELAEKGDLDRDIIEKIELELAGEKGQEEVENNVRTALFQCLVCGYVYEGDAVPYEYVCPVCGQPGHKFQRIQ